MALPLREWSLLGLSRIIGEDSAKELVDYLIQMSPSDAREYCEGLLGDAPDAKVFTNELVRRLEKAFSAAAASDHNVASASTPAAFASTHASSASGGARTQSSQPSTAVTAVSASSRPRDGRNAGVAQSGGRRQGESTAGDGSSRGAGGGGGSDGAAPVRPVMDIGTPAPSSCACFARSHPLLGNCLWCGRVLCVEHGWTRCTCGAALPSHVLVAGGNKLKQVPAEGGATIPSTAPQGELATPAISEAIARKERLLQFDRTSASRTRVLDDDSDYFSTLHSSWASQEEKEAAMAAVKAAKEKEERDKRGLKISLDFAGRAVVVRDERAEAEAATQARLLAIARGEIHGAHGAVLSAPSHAGGDGSVPVPSIADAHARAASGAAAGAQLSAARQAAGVGSGAFANHTLTGRAGEIYDAIVSEMVKKGRATEGGSVTAAAAPSHGGGEGGGARQGAGVSRLQHEELAATMGT